MYTQAQLAAALDNRAKAEAEAARIANDPAHAARIDADHAEYAAYVAKWGRLEDRYPEPRDRADTYAADVAALKGE